MYLSKTVLIIDRVILQFYIDYLMKFYINAYFYKPTAQNTWDFLKITTIWSQYIYIYLVVDMDYVDESDVVMFTVTLTL